MAWPAHAQQPPRASIYTPTTIISLLSAIAILLPLPRARAATRPARVATTRPAAPAPAETTPLEGTKGRPLRPLPSKDSDKQPRRRLCRRRRHRTHAAPRTPSRLLPRPSSTLRNLPSSAKSLASSFAARSSRPRRFPPLLSPSLRWPQSRRPAMATHKTTTIEKAMKQLLKTAIEDS